MPLPVGSTLITIQVVTTEDEKVKVRFAFNPEAKGMSSVAVIDGLAAINACLVQSAVQFADGRLTEAEVREWFGKDTHEIQEVKVSKTASDAFDPKSP